MSTRFVTLDRDTPMLLPVDLRDWLPPDHIVHFILDSVETLNLQRFVVNVRGTGSEQYPPAMMLPLLIYCYATGRFSSGDRGGHVRGCGGALHLRRGSASGSRHDLCVSSAESGGV